MQSTGTWHHAQPTPTTRLALGTTHHPARHKLGTQRITENACCIATAGIFRNTLPINTFRFSLSQRSFSLTIMRTRLPLNTLQATFARTGGKQMPPM